MKCFGWWLKLQRVSDMQPPREGDNQYSSPPVSPKNHNNDQQESPTGTLEAPTSRQLQKLSN